MNKQKFINYKENKYLFTDDNWKTVCITNGTEPPSSYIKEKNLNVTREVKLKFEYGDKAGRFIIKELRKIGKTREDLTGQKFNRNGGYGDEFEIMCASVLHNVSYEDAINNLIVNGDADAGIDIIFKNDAKKECIIYQVKIDLIKDNALARMKETIDDYIKCKLQNTSNSKDLHSFLDSNIPNIRDYCLKYKTISENSALSNNIKPERIFTLFIEQKVCVIAERKTLRIHLESSTSDIKTYAALDNNSVIFSFANADTFVEDLTNCFGNDDFVEKAFVNNVRGYEGDDPALAKTIEDSPEMFCSFNNGVSITGLCKIDNEENNYFVDVQNASIINGQQTIVNLFHCKNSGKDIKKIHVPVFIKKFKTEKEQSNIAKYNNTQKSVAPIDLLSLDPNVRKIQKNLLIPKIKASDKETYYLNIFSSGDKTCIKNGKAIFGSSEMIKLVDFIKLYSVIENPTLLGLWKNNYNKQIENEYKDGFKSCEIEKAKNICEAIKRSKKIIKGNRGDYAIADLALQYLLYLGIPEDESKKIIDKTTVKYGAKLNRKADVYKKNKTYSYIVDSTPAKYKNLYQ